MIRAFAALAFLLPSLAFAQLNLSPTEPLLLSITPQYPRPGGTVTVSPQSTAVNLANSTMTLSVDGKQMYAGPTRAMQVQLNPIGQATTVRVVVTGGGQTISKTVSLTPGDVSLVAEPLATTPALYKGRALVPQNGNVRIVAVADLRSSPSARIDPDTLSYTWSVNGTNLIAASGVGKTSVVVPAPLQYRNQTVSVTVQSRGGSLVGGDSFSLAPQDPTLRLYVRDPLQGVLYDHALSRQFSITKSEAMLVATPYSFSTAPSIVWFLDGSSAETGGQITLRPQGGGEGSATLSVTASDTNIDPVTETLSLTFGQASSNLFGL